MLRRFLNEWIPMENKYFEAFDIEGKSDLVYDNVKKAKYGVLDCQNRYNMQDIAY